MAKPKNSFPSYRYRLDGNLRMQAEGVTLEERDQVFYQWMLDNQGKAATMARQIITSMLHGELGGGVQWALETANEEELQKQMQAARDVFANFVVEDI